MKISSESEMAESFNCHFANIGHDLARDIPVPCSDTVPDSFLISTNATFFFNSCSSNEVRKLVEKLETEKPTGLDNLPSKMLKLVSGVLASFLAFFFNQSIPSGIVPTEWKLQYNQLQKFIFIDRFVQCTGERTIGHVVPC